VVAEKIIYRDNICVQRSARGMRPLTQGVGAKRNEGAKQMSKACLDLLNTIGLLSVNQPVELSKFDEGTLSKLLRYYYEQRAKTLNDEVGQLRQDQTLSALVSSFSARNAVAPLLPSFLIHGHVITDDPLFRVCTPESEMGAVQKQAMGMNVDRDIDRVMIANKLLYFSMLAPLINAGLLTVLPIHMLHLPPEHLPVFYAEDRFRSEIPENIHDFIHKSSIIAPVVLHKESGALIIPKEPVREPCRAIHVSFVNDFSSSSVGIYFYQTMQPEEVDRESGRIKVSLSWSPDEPLREDVFDGWVYQSINRTIIQRLGAMSSEIRLAASLNHSYMTESGFESALLAQCGFRGEDAASGAVNFLNANETLIEIPSPEDVVRLREKHAEAFMRFRASLIEIGEKLRGIPPGEFREKAERLYHIDIQPQIDEMQKSVRSVCTSLGKGALVSLGGVAYALASGTALPLVAASLYATSGALTEALPALSEYMSARKKPEYIWRKLHR
jgi:hypothetical protein